MTEMAGSYQESEPIDRTKQRQMFRLLRGAVRGAIRPNRVYHTLHHMGHTDAILGAAGLALDESLRTSASIELSSTWLQRAATSFDRVIDLTGSAGDKITSYNGAAAAIRKAQLPNYATYIATGELPGGQIAQKSYDQTIEVIGKIKGGMNELIADKRRQVAKLALVGALAEADVLALGQRYAIREHTDKSWFPMPSMHAEDHHEWGRDNKQEAWDISVYTHLKSAPDVSYKVQVKSSSYALERDNHDYGAAGVEILCVDPHLKIGSERYTTIRIANELLQESLGNTGISSRLDTRTDKLLDVLG